MGCPYLSSDNVLLLWLEIFFPAHYPNAIWIIATLWSALIRNLLWQLIATLISLIIVIVYARKDTYTIRSMQLNGNLPIRNQCVHKVSIKLVTSLLKAEIWGQSASLETWPHLMASLNLDWAYKWACLVSPWCKGYRELPGSGLVFVGLIRLWLGRDCSRTSRESSSSPRCTEGQLGSIHQGSLYAVWPARS